MHDSKSSPQLPDVSHPEPSLDWGTTLPWVGMREIEIPLRVRTAQGSLLLSARLDFGVSLDRKEARGIHMSRLYRLASEQLPKQDLSFQLLGELAAAGLQSHHDLSTKTQLALRFSLPLERQALKSEGRGWRTYPVTLRFTKSRSGEASAELEVEVLYSSTCPASAALSRQINQQVSLEHFKSETITRKELEQWLISRESLAATPHAQRSRARVRVGLSADDSRGSISELAAQLIERTEAALGTPVQTLVKREDEQEFARRNASHLMFCEDAARALMEALESAPEYEFWSGEVAHFESLHPHDAVAQFQGRRSSSQTS